jgi:hypothetical protein
MAVPHFGDCSLKVLLEELGGNQDSKRVRHLRGQICWHFMPNDTLTSKRS